MLHPQRHSHGAKPAALAAEVDDDPAVLAQLDLGDVERGQFPPPERAADQEREDAVVALPFQRGACHFQSYVA